MSGIVFVDKPEGPTSHTVVAQARRALGIKKIGHAGTLDPMASGLMTLGVGSSTRLLTFLVGLDKTYRTTLRLGQATVTDDAWGDPLGPAASAPVLEGVTSDAIRQALQGFVGEIAQRPSAVSAIKVAGQRAYDRVRQGEKVELAARPVTIHSITIDRVTRIDTAWEVECEVRCSSGTYIRALARDLGEALGLGGHLTSLRRTSVGPWSVEQAVSVDAITPEALIDPATAITAVMPSVVVDAATELALGHGKKVQIENAPQVRDGDPVAVLSHDHRVIAVVTGVSGPARILVGFPKTPEAS